MSDPISYHIETFGDIVNKIPRDRVKVYLDQMAELIEACHALRERHEENARCIGVDDWKPLQFASGMIWIDDGLGDITISLESDEVTK